MATLTLTFLGSFQAMLDGVPIARFRSDKVRALLVYLAVEADRPHTRASLCGLLWPDQPDDGLTSAIVRALDLTVQGGDLTARLLRALRDKHMLIVLDNFEHLLDGPWPKGHPGSGQGTGLVIELLQSAPRLRIVATSRERLNVRGEQRYVVQGMAYRPDAMDADAADLAAVRLFARALNRYSLSSR